MASAVISPHELWPCSCRGSHTLDGYLEYLIDTFIDFLLTRDLSPDARASADRRGDLLTALITATHLKRASPSALGKGEF
jgi:hypothetical protein